MQTELFGGQVIGWLAVVLIGEGEDDGRLVLHLMEPGAPQGSVLRVGGLVKGTGIVRFAASPLFGLDPRPAAPCRILDASGHNLLLALPPRVSPAPHAGAERPFSGVSMTMEGAFQ